MIEALIFDFDGLILDTEVPVFQAWGEIFQEYGCELTLDVWMDYIGSSPDSFDPLQHLADCVDGLIDRDELLARQRRREAQLIEGEVVMPGVVAYLEAARARGLHVAIASSSPRAWVVEHLERLGLRGYFPQVITADDVARVKPAPDLFLAALRALGAAPEGAIVLEDSPNGVRAANLAGIYVVAVPNAITRHYPLDHADLVIPSLADLSLDELIKIARPS
jgi:HAD superfamily hydrolase (TIGR01509 family)